MKSTFVLFVLVSGVLLAGAHAATKPVYQPATVVSVESHDITPYYAGDSSDAPFQPEVYSYDIGILIGDTVYRASYDSAFDDLPTAFAPNHSIQVNLKKRVLDVELPGDRTLQMAITSRASVKSASGSANN